MAIVKWNQNNLYDPWADLERLQDEINALFNIDKYPGRGGLFDRKFSPAVDVIENDHDYVIACELPGLNQEDIDVSIASNVLTIKGSKKDEKQDKGEKYFRKETWSGSFQRTLPMPGYVDAEKIQADLKDGILKIVIPKKEEAKPKQISVKVK